MAWIQVKAAKCDKCSHVWIPDLESPKRCPRCRTKVWNARAEVIEQFKKDTSDSELIDVAKKYRKPKVKAVNLDDLAAVYDERHGEPKLIRAGSPQTPKMASCPGCGSLGGMHQKWCPK